MEFLKLYDVENRDILYSMSWLNKNSIFDKSTGSFEEIDLFTFLENINEFDYNEDIFYDDMYYVLEYTKGSILHLINNINKEIKREHKILPISQAREFDKKTIMWLSRQDGRTVKEKLKNNKIKTVKRYRNVDTYENRIFKIFLKKLILVDEARCEIQSNDHLISKIRQWLRSDDAKNINEYGNIVYNNILLHHPHYSKIFKSYKWLNRLDEKVDYLVKKYPAQIRTILKFEIFTQLQFLSAEYILPNNLDIDLNTFNIKKDSLLINLNIDNVIKKINSNVIQEKLPFNSIRNFSKYLIEKKLNIKQIKDRSFYIADRENEVYIDLFRLFPIARTKEHTIEFPITLKQRVDNKIVNANNTKIINLNNEIYTLPEILKTYDTSILRYFLDDFEKYFKDKQLNYIVPDYVNIFEFSQVKKSINSYFPNNRNIPKSILAGLGYLFSGKLQNNDTLIYIQKDHNNNLHVTPLLVKFDKNLQSVTKGLYLEKHPTKKLLEENDTLNELNKYFDKEQSFKLLNKFLQNGIKGIKQHEIALYLDKKIIYLQNTKNINARDRKHQVRKLFHSKKLFQKNIIDIRDSNKKNLYNFEKLLNYEKGGITLWKEHLPRLAMQLPMNGYFDNFILVDENSKIINGTIEIKNNFKIPSNTKELSFPLIFGDENINFEAYLASNDLPLKEDLECELELTYNYEAETPYKLTFIALDNSIKPLKVKWREIQYKDCADLPIPPYPSKKSWEDLTNKKLNGSTLLKNIEACFNKIIKFSKYLQDTDRESTTLSNNWKIDASNKKYQYITTASGDTRIYKNNLFNVGDRISYKVVKKERFQEAVNIISNSDYSRLKKEIRFPLLTIWNNGYSLSDINVPTNFRLLAKDAIQAAEEILHLTDIDIELKSAMLFFLASLHQDAPEIIINLLDEYSKKSEKNNIIPYSLGHMKLDWQKNIFKNILNNINLDQKLSDNLKIFGIVAWRYDNFIIKLAEREYTILTSKLYKSLVQDMKREYIYSYNRRRECNEVYQTIVNKLELLLALIRYRMNDACALKPNINLTKQYVKIIDDITSIVIKEKLNIYSRIQLNITKPESFKNTPDLLYALRVYLSGDSGAAKTIQVLGVSDD